MIEYLYAIEDELLLGARSKYNYTNTIPVAKVGNYYILLDKQYRNTGRWEYTTIAYSTGSKCRFIFVQLHQV